MEQISMWPPLGEVEDAEEIKRQADVFLEYAREKRNWENAFQKWSDSQWDDDYTSMGKCGYGAICDWCEDNSYGRPCVRALNAMCRDKGISIDYSNRNFEEIWRM